MPLGSNPVQLVPPGNAQLVVDTITDPNGAPADVLDVDLGFTVSGSVTMPIFLTSEGTVCLYADELGGPLDARIACTKVKFDQKPGEPPSSQTVPWAISYPADATTTIPDPSSGSQLYRLAVVFVYGDQSWDIAGFVELGTYLIN
jgi:hypothetical protein